jgi:integrase
MKSATRANTMRKKIRAKDTHLRCARPVASCRAHAPGTAIPSLSHIVRDRGATAGQQHSNTGATSEPQPGNTKIFKKNDLWTYATLIALLSVTGLRISEALKLTVADLTRDGLLIRETKFRKTRLTPLHDTAVAGLERYLARRRPSSEADPVFVDARGLPLRYIAVKETFDRLVGRAGIVLASRRRPRLHDLRHTFAVRVLQCGAEDRSRRHANIVALATYMGHVNIYATYWYLEATADLMRDVATAGEAFFTEGRQS